MKLLSACEYAMGVSMGDLVVFPDPEGRNFIPNPDLQAALVALGVKVDIIALYEQFFKEPRLGLGDVHAFQSSTTELNVFVIDMYQDRVNQVDFVAIAFRCDGSIAPTVGKHLRAFFDAASVQAGYEEANCLPRFRELFDPTQYPRVIQETGYMQQFHLLRCG